MKAKTQKMIVEDFIAGATEGKCGGAGNLKISNNKLIHYQTVIAERENGNVFIVNMTRYSLVTGRIQKDIIQLTENDETIIVTGIPEGFKGDLRTFANK